MSQINDALKQVRKVPPRGTGNSLPPLQPIARESSPIIAWLMPTIVIFLVIAAIFFIGWAVAHNTVHTIVTAPETVSVTQQVQEVTLPVVAPEPPPPIDLPDAPRLQGIFYSATAPSAIVEGKTVRPGDRFQQYRVKAITKSTVVLVDADGKVIQLGMSN